MPNLIEEVGLVGIILHPTTSFLCTCMSPVDDHIIINGGPQILNKTKFSYIITNTSTTNPQIHTSTCNVNLILNGARLALSCPCTVACCAPQSVGVVTGEVE